MIRLSLPSKTILFGEYAVLAGGSAVVLNHAPRFELISGEGRFEVPKNSPTDRMVNSRSLLGWNFVDPHDGRGGFGASSAQFVFSYAIQTQDLKSGFLSQNDILKLHQEYLKYSRQDEGYQPSGTDLIAQVLGQTTLLKMTEREFVSTPWPWKEVGFAVFKTQNKIPTHAHLKSLSPTNFEKLVKLSRLSSEHFNQKNLSGFLEHLAMYSEELMSLGLTLTETQKSVVRLLKLPGVVLAKGCGAMGADVIVTLLQRTAGQSAGDPNNYVWAQELGLEWIADESMLSPGFICEEL